VNGLSKVAELLAQVRRLSPGFRKQNITSIRQVRFPETGDYKVSATAFYGIGNSASFSFQVSVV